MPNTRQEQEAGRFTSMMMAHAPRVDFTADSEPGRPGTPTRVMFVVRGVTATLDGYNMAYFGKYGFHRPVHGPE